MVSLFGWEFIRQQTPQEEIKNQPALALPDNDDGSIIVSASNYYGTYYNNDPSIRNDAELVTKYREVSFNPEVDNAIEEIVNEAITLEEDKIVKIVLSDLPYTESTKKIISDTFNEILDLLKFNMQAFELFKRWYVDARLNFQILIDKDNPQNGIVDLRYIDPRKIVKIKEIVKKRDIKSGTTDLQQPINEYYIYNENGFKTKKNGSFDVQTGLRIGKDSIVHVTSGLTNEDGTMVYSHLHRVIKPLNQLRMMEDASIIHKLARAPQRRVWYIDVGALPRPKAEQYVRDIATKQKNRLVYDASTGQVRTDSKYTTIMEDFYLSRREGGKGTEVTTIPGDDSWDNMDSINYFLQKLYMALKVPINRLNPDNPFLSGRATEITRDEVKFGKFIDRLRQRFSMLFLELLKRQIVLKQIMTIEEFESIQNRIKFDFARDNYFLEQKDIETYTSRAQAADQLIPFTSKYYSHNWIRRNIFKQSDEDMAEEDKIIHQEYFNPVLNRSLFAPTMGQEGDPMQNGDQPPPDQNGFNEEKENNKYKETYNKLKKGKTSNV